MLVASRRPQPPARPGRPILFLSLSHWRARERFMRYARRTAAGLAAAATLWLAGGCGEGPPAGSVDSSKTEATVKGVVKVNGTPATEGELIFDPSNIYRKDAQPRTAPIGQDGSYTVKTLTGENAVRLG